MNRIEIERAISRQHPTEWVSQMGSSKLVRPRVRPEKKPGSGREAAVMLLVFPTENDGSLQTILTRRKDSLSHHPGQISLPGGRRDDSETLEEAARREVDEEIGVESSAPEILGTLNPIYIPPSDFTVTPFAGWLPEEPKFKLEPDEVAELIRVPLTLLLDPSIRKVSSVSTDARQRDVPWFSLGGHQVWGATAMILDDFAQRLQRESSD